MGIPFAFDPLGTLGVKKKGQQPMPELQPRGDKEKPEPPHVNNPHKPAHGDKPKPTHPDSPHKPKKP